MKGISLRRVGLAAVVPVAFCVALLGDARPAVAWTSTLQDFHVRMRNNTGGPVNDCTVRVMGRVGGVGPWQAPQFVGQMTFAAGWGFVGWSVVGNSLVYKWAGLAIPPGASGIFNPYFRIQGAGAPWQSAAFFQWTLDGTPVGQEVAVGFCTSSPVKLGNPEVRPDGTTNTVNIVVRNLQFAQSPSQIPNDQMNPDSPAINALFTASADPVRPGPFTVTPGTCQDVVPDLHPSITAPVIDGQTVLARGIVEDQVGQQYDFLVQFIWGEVLPSVSPWGIVLLALVLLTMGAIMVRRTQTHGQAA